MKLRTLIIVAVALAVVTMAGYTIRNASLTTPEDDPIIGTQVFDQDILKEVNRVEINKAGSEAVLELNQSGEWVVRSLYDLPTDFAKLNSLIQDLVDATVERKITGREDRLERLDLTQGTIKLMSGEGKSLFEITYGKSVAGGKSFIFGNEKTAYLSSESPLVDADSANWAVKTLYQFPVDNVAGLQFSLTGESWGVRRDDKDKDFVSTLPVDLRVPKQSSITSLINRFTNLRFVEVSKRAAEEATQTWKDAQKNVRSMKLTLFSGETISIKMSQWEPPAPDDEDAAPSYTPSVTYLHISSSQADHPINSLMDRLAFKASSYTFTGIPIEISEVADLPEEEPEEPEVSDQTSPTPATQETAETVEELVEQKASAQPQIKQHIDGNSVIFEVIPAKKDGEESPAPEETKPEKN